MASRQAQPFAPDERAQRKADPNKRWRWLIPVVVLAQVALKARKPGDHPCVRLPWHACQLRANPMLF